MLVRNGVVVTAWRNADVRTGDTVQFSAQVTGGGAMVAPPSPPDRRLNRDEGQRQNFMGNAQPSGCSSVVVGERNCRWQCDFFVGTISDKGLYTAPALLADPLPFTLRQRARRSDVFWRGIGLYLRILSRCCRACSLIR